MMGVYTVSDSLSPYAVGSTLPPVELTLHTSKQLACDIGPGHFPLGLAVKGAELCEGDSNGLGSRGPRFEP